MTEEKNIFMGVDLAAGKDESAAWILVSIDGLPYTTYKVNSESDLVAFWGSLEKGFNKMGLNNTECCNTTP